MNSNGSISGSGIGLRCTITQTPEPGDRIWLMYKANDVSTWDKAVSYKHLDVYKRQK